MFHQNQPRRTTPRRFGMGLTAGAMLALASIGFSNGPVEAAGGGQPEQIRDQYVESYEDPNLAAACGIETVEIVEHGDVGLTLFPNGTQNLRLMERGVWSNPATGNELTTLQVNRQASSSERTQDGDILNIIQHISVSGLGEKVRVPGHGTISIQAGHFESVLTVQLDVSTDPPTLLSFEEEVLSSAGSIRDSVSTDELAAICEGLGGSLVLD